MNRKQPWVLTILLALTAAAIYTLSDGDARTLRHPGLAVKLAALPGWGSAYADPVPQNIVSALELDEYVNSAYTDGNATVSLYIGFYHTARKIGAAHDPLVCFPGQGWMVSDRQNGTYPLKSVSGAELHYASMIATIGQRRDYIFYWFQSEGRTSAGTLAQKLWMIGQKIAGTGEDNAFVRLTTSLENKSVDQARADCLRFVEAFYPVFLKYVEE